MNDFLTNKAALRARLLLFLLFSTLGLMALFLRLPFVEATTNSPVKTNKQPALAAPLAIGPGGINSNLQLWLKADAGVSESGGNVSAWADQSGNARHAT